MSAPGLATAQAASLCAKGFSSAWDVVASSNFTMVRTGTWSLYGGSSQATATETDVMSSVKHPPFHGQALSLDEACSPWELTLDSFIRPGVADLSGQWNQSAGSGLPAAQGACRAHKVVTATPDTDPITINLVGMGHGGVGVFFNNSARNIKFVVTVFLAPPFGLTCETPFGPAQFDFPQYTESSTVITLPAQPLKRDRGFTLRFSGSGTRTEPWLSPGQPGASEHFDVTWTGALHFRAAGCQETFFLTGKTSPRCFPG